MSAKEKQNSKDNEQKRRGEDASEDDLAQPWKGILRPTCALPCQDNSFTLEDDVAASVVEGVLSSVTVSDPNEDGNPVCFVSPGYLSMTGYTEEECLGSGLPFLQAGKADMAGLEELRRSMAARRFSSAELASSRKDGRALNHLLALTPVPSSDDTTLLHWVSAHCDLDERRRRGEPVDGTFVSKWIEQVQGCLSAFALVDVSEPSVPTMPARAARGGAASSADASSPRPSPTPPSASICSVSPGFTALTGYSQSDVLGLNMLSLCGSDTSEQEMRKLLMAQWAHNPAVVKLLCYKRDGTPFWAMVLNFPLSSAASSDAGGSLEAQDRGQQGSTTGRHAQPAAARQAQAQAGAGAGVSGRARKLGGLLGSIAGASGSGGLLNGIAASTGAAPSASRAALPGGADTASQPPKYCLCCVVDVTAQRLKKVVGGKYVLGKMIGAGAFGLVRIGKNTATDELVAVKGVDATRFRSITEIEQIQEEMAVLSSLKHPNIIRLFDVHFQNNTFFLVMEFAGAGSLVHYMHRHGDPTHHRLDEATCGRLFAQMVSALDYCHRRRVIHRDLKPENILMDDQQNLKIADFGLAAVTAPFNGGLTLQCGTPEFTAPEITTGREYDGPSVDIWSMGVILYEMLSGSLPFKGANQAALFKAIQRGVYDPLPSYVSDDCKDLVRRMLAVDPSSRIDMEQMLHHPWVMKATTNADAAPTPGVPRADGPVVPGPRASRSGSGAGGDVAGGGAARREADSGPYSQLGRGKGSQDGGGPRDAGSASSAGGSGYRSHGLGPESFSGPHAAGQGPAGDTGSPDLLHDSVKLTIPAQTPDREDPIIAALLRSNVAPGVEVSMPSFSSAIVATGSAGLGCGAAAPRRETSAPVAMSRTCASRSAGGTPAASSSILSGHVAQGGGKARGGALLPSLAGGAGNGGLNGALDRRLQEPSRYRSPARAGQAPGTAAATRGGVNGRGQFASAQMGTSPSSALSGSAADAASRQLPPIQSSRSPGKVSSRMHS